MQISDVTMDYFLQFIKSEVKLPDLSKDFREPSFNLDVNAIIGWENQDLNHGYAESFYKAGKLMIEKGADFYDYYVYPIMFNYRQYIELALKDLLIKSQVCFNQSIKVNITHDLETVLTSLCDILDSQDKAFLLPEEIRQFILMYYKQDKKNDRYRYPYDTKGNLTNSYDHHFINLEVIYNSMELVHEYLFGIYLIFDEIDEAVYLHFLNFINKITSFKNVEELKDKTNDKLYVIEFKTIPFSVLTKKIDEREPKKYLKLDNANVVIENNHAEIPIIYLDIEKGIEKKISVARYEYVVNKEGVKKINSFSVDL
ncbi:hypothetical protein ACFFIF_08010 [Vagococcus entomophilus]|uniref:HEPN domain-containing protein n=1 Tax=Vagococcus entomophilus TaxID=1160095 RepID=A0A430AH87_9ENTE|nr:hypothetical protein [Vagococcus entomophilus]RSU07292.1 hypothetical protein CBF30_08555 [Vagococcus entomophilus]